MKNSLTYCRIPLFALYAVLICPLFAAAAENKASPIEGISPEDFQTLKSENPADAFKKAALVYEKFGYAAPLVELAKTNPEAKEKLGKIVEFLKESAGKNAYYNIKLAEIMYLTGDFAQFEKYASANRSFSERMLVTPLGNVLDYPVFISSDNWRTSSIKSGVIQKAIDSGDIKTANRMLKENFRQFTSDSWYLMNLYVQLYFKNEDPEAKREILAALDREDAARNYADKDVVTYALTEDDPEFKDKFEKAKAALEKIPAERRYAMLAQFYSNFDRRENSDKKAFYLKKLYDAGAELSAYDKRELACYYIHGTLNYSSDEVPDSFKTNPNRETALKLLEEYQIASAEDYVLRTIISAYKALEDKEKVKFWTEKLLKPSGRGDSWSQRYYIQQCVTKNDYSVTPKEEIEKVISSLSSSEKGELFMRIGEAYRHGWDDVIPDARKAKEYYLKSLEAGYNSAFENFTELCTPEESAEMYKKYSSAPEVEFFYAKYLAKYGDWEGAFKHFKSADEKEYFGSPVALLACYAQGKGVPKNDEETEKLMVKITAEMQGGWSSSSLTYNYVARLIDELSDASPAFREKFMHAAARNAAVSQEAKRSLLGFYRSAPLAGKTEKIRVLLEEFSVPGLSDRELSSTLFRFYSADWEFRDLPKAFEYAKSCFNNENYGDGSSYIWMLIRGIGVEKDEKKALEEVQKMGGQEYYENTKNIFLAYFYENGIGVEKDAAKAEEYRKKVGKNSNYWILRSEFAPKKQAEYLYYMEKDAERTGNYTQVAEIYKGGRYGTPKDDAKAIGLYEKSADKNPDALLEIAAMYKGLGPLYNPEKHFEYLQKYAQKIEALGKDLSARYFMMAGCAYMNGRGTAKDEKKAFDCFSKAEKLPASTHTLPAMAAVAFCYENGLGAEKDADKAKTLRADIRRIAVGGIYPMDDRRLWDVMKLYDFDAANLHVDVDAYISWLEFYAEKCPNYSSVSELFLVYTRKPQMRDWKKAFAALNLYREYWPDTSWGNYRMGYFMLFGIEMPKNIEKGVWLLKRSADVDYPYAMELLSYVYEKGLGVEKNAEEAQKWLDKFKEYVNPPYMEISSRYIRGSDNIEDVERAKFILKIGADAGDPACKYHLENFDAYVKSRLAVSVLEAEEAERKAR